jgi:hypothetical protein
MMLTSQSGCEEGQHTITFRETDGLGAARAYLPQDLDPALDLLYAVKLSRHCADGEHWCIGFTSDTFAPQDIVYWYVTNSRSGSAAAHKHIITPLTKSRISGPANECGFNVGNRMERAYLQPSTGTGPSMDEYVMSYVLTFDEVDEVDKKDMHEPTFFRTQKSRVASATLISTA